MVYIFGDTHGSLEIDKISNKKFPEAKTLGKGDYIIICGDFGFPFLPADYIEGPIDNQTYRHSRKEFRHWVNWMAKKPFKILFVDGNHDNHAFWSEQKREFWHGGMIQRMPGASNIIHLMRGEYYTIDGHTFWTFGGATSIDAGYRIPGVSWWPEEEASYAEKAHGLETLEKHGNQVDYIITHTAPRSAIAKIAYPTENDSTERYFDIVLEQIKGHYGLWFCGHMHEDIFLYDKEKDMHIQVAYKKHFPIDDDR